MAASVLTFKLVKSEIDQYAQEISIKEPSKAFLCFVIERFLEIDTDDAKEAIVDGSHDQGIDAIYIDDDSDDRAVVYLWQSKFYEKENKFDSAFEGNAVTKMQSAIQNLILKLPKSSTIHNPYLLNKLKDIRALKNPRYEIIFCSNSAEPHPTSKHAFEEFIKAASNGQDFFRTTYLTLDKINSLITPDVTKKIDANLQLSGDYFEWSRGDVKVIAGRLQAKVLADLRDKEGKNLFDKNVRGYLSKKNVVNKDIYESATSAESAHRFFYLNNGITIVCDDAIYLQVDESPLVEIKNLQIVNGGQTTNSLHEAAIAGELPDSVYVLTKIIATKNTRLISEIAESTNKQTNVQARDLHSNDHVQKQIEKMLRNRGFFYESRKNKYKDTAGAKGKRIDMSKAAQSYYAIYKQQPAAAKNKKRDLFGDLYTEIFKEADSGLPDKILFSHLALEWIRKSHTANKLKFNFVKYAEFHSLALLFAGEECNIEVLNNASIQKRYNAVLEATAKVVSDESKRLAERYSHRALFILNTTLGQIKANISSTT